MLLYLRGSGDRVPDSGLEVRRGAVGWSARGEHEGAGREPRELRLAFRTTGREVGLEVSTAASPYGVAPALVSVRHSSVAFSGPQKIS